jgi:hypothetical protein
VAIRLDPLRQGLKAEYYLSSSWTPPVAIVGFDRRPAGHRFFDTWNGAPPERFSVAWSGSLLAPRAGTYELATDSDDGSYVYVDGRLVVDNGGLHPRRLAWGSIELTRGPHALLVLYNQVGGSLYFELEWARNGAALAPVPAWALWGRKVGSLARVLPSLLLFVGAEAFEFAAVALLAIACVVSAFVKLRAALDRAGLWREMRWVLGGSFVLNISGIWWGLPDTWVAIETLPAFVLSALAQRFSHGWFDAYPPLHYYLLSLAGIPVLLLHSKDVISYYSPAGSTALILSYRLLSVILAVGTVAATAFIGLRAFGKRAGVLAAGIAALVAPFVYYAKTANVDGPYVFWYSLSLVFFVQMLQESRLRDYVLFGATATMALCTKDQAYALYISAPVVIVAELWREQRMAGVARPLAKALVDRRLLAATAAASVTFVLVCNLLFNFSGYVNHLRSIREAAAVYGVFDATASGRWQLFLLTCRLVRDAMGWPFLAASLAGFAIGLATPRWRRSTLWLAAAVPAYYLGLINVVLYNYDRFMLPICVLFAVFGGFALDRLLAAAVPTRRWQRALVAGAFAYSILYAATVDVLMIGDSRYLVGRWMATHIPRETVVGAMGPYEYLPRLDDYYVSDISTTDELTRERPHYFILDADYVRAASGDFARLAERVQSGHLGYQLAFRYRRETPLSLLPGAHPDLVGDRHESPVFSILRNVNPTIEIFEDQLRGPPRGAPSVQ